MPSLRKREIAARPEETWTIPALAPKAGSSHAPAFVHAAAADHFMYGPPAPTTPSHLGRLSGGRRVKQRARELLSKVGLEERLRHRPSQLSGGERQRVAIARALIAEPKVILADEPTGNLDSNTAAGILDLIWEINEERRISFLLVTHNEAVARRCDRRIRLRDGSVESREVGRN